MKSFLSALARFFAVHATPRGDDPKPEELASANLGLAPEAYVIVDAYFGVYAHALPRPRSASVHADAS